MRVALVCIAKNEDHYIKEWCDYHLKLGFDQIFIYQNDWVCDLEMENVTKLTMNGPTKQMESYNTFIKTYHQEFDWAAFFDVDEFLVLKKHNSVKDFISDYSEYDAIGINWVFFGDNNITELENNTSVLKRFTKRQKGINSHIKTILKMNDGVFMSIHNPIVPNEIVDTNFNKFSGPFNPNGDDNIAQLNHYFVKTKKEFIQKIDRGRPDITIKRNISDFEPHNLNDIDDFSALNFYIK